MTANEIQKYKDRPIPWLIKLATKSFNEFIRKRDTQSGYFKCISCQSTKDTEQLNAGHYLSAGNHSALRFNERNVHGQCIKCNYHLHGNLVNYRSNLINKIGLDEIELLEMQNGNFKWDRFSLIEIIYKYKKLNKTLFV